MLVKKKGLSHDCDRPIKISRTLVNNDYIKPDLFQSTLLNVNIVGSKLEDIFFQSGRKKIRTAFTTKMD